MYERNRLYFERFKMIPAPLPPIDEQAKIVHFINNETQFVTEAITRAQHEIALVGEYRRLSKWTRKNSFTSEVR